MNLPTCENLALVGGHKLAVLNGHDSTSAQTSWKVIRLICCVGRSFCFISINKGVWNVQCELSLEGCHAQDPIPSCCDYWYRLYCRIYNIKKMTYWYWKMVKKLKHLCRKSENNIANRKHGVLSLHTSVCLRPACKPHTHNRVATDISLLPIFMASFTVFISSILTS